MTTVGGLLLALWLVAATVSLVCVRDLLSPDKLILAALGVFFLDIFISPYPAIVAVAYALLLLAFMMAVIGSSTLVQSAGADRTPARRPHPAEAAADRIGRGHLLFWILSVPALVAQVALVLHFGGIVGYINVLALRVIEFQGLGWLTSIIQTFAIVDLMYFAYLVTRARRGVFDWALYLTHLLVFTALALLTGSRGSLLVNFVLMAVVRHYLVKPLRLRFLAGLAAAALLVASVLEVAREGVGFGEEGLVTGLSDSRGGDRSYSFAWATYGTLSLRLVLEFEVVRTHLGLTYLTWFTNAVPRAFWPDKPDTGGVVLTKEYTGDAWGGSSHLSTGILPEAIINFGQAGGLAVGVAQLAFVLVAMLALYARCKVRLARGGNDAFVTAVRFAYLSWGMTALVVGEFTNVMLTLTVQLLTLWLVHATLRALGLFDPRALGAPAR